MNPLTNINPATSSSPGIGELQSLLKTPQGASETQAFQETLASLLGSLLSQNNSSSQGGDEEVEVVPTGSTLRPLEISLMLAQINKAGKS